MLNYANNVVYLFSQSRRIGNLAEPAIENVIALFRKEGSAAGVNAKIWNAVQLRELLSDSLPTIFYYFDLRPAEEQPI